VLTETSVEPDSTYKAIQDSLAQVMLSSRFGIFSDASHGILDTIVLENSKIQIRVATKGASPASVWLKEYKQYSPEGNGADLLLFDPDSNNFEYAFNANGKEISSAELFFKPVGINTSMELTLRAEATEGRYIELHYQLEEDSYMVQHELRVVGLENEINPSNIALNWKTSGLANEKHLETERRACSVYYKYFNDSRDYLSEAEADLEKLEGKTNWVAFKQDFFTLAMISDAGFSGNGSEIEIIPSTDTTHTKAYRARLYFDERAGSSVSIPMRFYMGPNHYQTLAATEVAEFDKVMDLGWGIFGTMNKWLVIPLFNWLSGFNWSYGIIILVLTLLIKLLLFPLTFKNYKSSAKMRVLKPQIDELTAKFKDKDPMKKQQATMDLYRKTGVNPAAGCLPMLIQMPILYAMFRFFPSSIELRQQSFLWAEDLSSYDSIFDFPGGFEIPFYGDHVSLFTLLMAISTIAYTQMNSSQMPTQAGMPNMKVMMWMFPIMMLFFLNNYSSGLSYYYLLANIISMGQMFLIKKVLIDEEKILVALEQNKKKKPKKKSRWMQKMEEIQKQQEAQSRKRGRK
jgi:YidC/Oxa1 family membrane protein insertase